MVEPNTGFVFDLNEPVEDNPVDPDAPVDWDAIAEDVFDFDEPLFQEEIEEDAQVNANHVAVEVPMEVGNHAARTRKRQTTDAERIHIYSLLLQNTTHFQGKGTLHNGVSLKIAQEMGVHQRTVQRIWQDGQEGGVNNVLNKKPKNCGHKRIEISPEVIQGVPLRQRTTMQDLARAFGVSKSTVHARLKEKQTKRPSNSIRSYLTPANKKAHVEFAISMLDRRKPHRAYR
ncbi:uncharacterized protein C2845_PM08G16470 [Panicum miliaceum]|uniref:DUF7769 domain-containing protein n=1 Tax=Panicum miliaceum TaxID=4540 RepID=A0A3L6R0T0_PANMI|nr:uncharacterized protein C2845_PM08G16470 [Panicum miliaceum]